jgi:hypothetical protein
LPTTVCLLPPRPERNVEFQSVNGVVKSPGRGCCEFCFQVGEIYFEDLHCMEWLSWEPLSVQGPVDVPALPFHGSNPAACGWISGDFQGLRDVGTKRSCGNQISENGFHRAKQLCDSGHDAVTLTQTVCSSTILIVSGHQRAPLSPLRYDYLAMLYDTHTGPVSVVCCSTAVTTFLPKG